jgi:hypothetical protein
MTKTYPITFTSKGENCCMYMAYNYTVNDKVVIEGVTSGLYRPVYSPKYGKLKMQIVDGEVGMYELKQKRWVRLNEFFCISGTREVIDQISPKLGKLFGAGKPIKFYLKEI